MQTSVVSYPTGRSRTPADVIVHVRATLHRASRHHPSVITKPANRALFSAKRARRRQKKKKNILQTHSKKEENKQKNAICNDAQCRHSPCKDTELLPKQKKNRNGQKNANFLPEKHTNRSCTPVRLNPTCSFLKTTTENAMTLYAPKNGKSR